MGMDALTNEVVKVRLMVGILLVFVSGMMCQPPFDYVELISFFVFVFGGFLAFTGESFDE